MGHTQNLTLPPITTSRNSPCPPNLMIPFGLRRSEEALGEQEGVVGQGVYEFLQLLLPAPVEIILRRIHILLLDFHLVVLLDHSIRYHLWLGLMVLRLSAFLEVSELVLFLLWGKRLLGGLFFLWLLEDLHLRGLYVEGWLFLRQNLMVWLGRPFVPEILYLSLEHVLGGGQWLDGGFEHKLLRFLSNILGLRFKICRFRLVELELL